MLHLDIKEIEFKVEGDKFSCSCNLDCYSSSMIVEYFDGEVSDSEIEVARELCSKFGIVTIYDGDESEVAYTVDEFLEDLKG